MGIYLQSKNEIREVGAGAPPISGDNPASFKIIDSKLGFKI